MFKRPSTWFVISLLCLAGAWYFWRLGEQWAAQRQPAEHAPETVPASQSSQPAARGAVTTSVPEATALLPRLTPGLVAGQKESPLKHRVSNTSKTISQLVRQDHALLLENALLDTEVPVALAIPPHLRAGVEAGSYIVQARGALDDTFRSRLRAAGATIIAYIPNNAYLVRTDTTGAERLAAFAETQVVLPYEPYYKLKGTLLPAAVRQETLPEGSGLNLMLFADAAAATKAALADLGVEIFAEERSPFGPIVRVKPAVTDWYALAALPGVQTMEWYSPRAMANDLSRVRTAVATAPQATTNYLGLSGTNVLVNVNDSWEYIEAPLPEHPDLTNRVIYGTPYSLVDSNGHATHVSGSIAGSGAVSATVTNARGSINPGVEGQYRGMAPGASILALPINIGTRPGQDFGGGVPDVYLQETPARTNALISNNSWHYANAGGYDLAAASYDAAVRDALPGVTGSQPVLFVFAAGNDGQGGDNGLGGFSDSIRSPGTAKNVITVGALEQPRDITNEVWKCSTINVDTNGEPVCSTNTPWKDMTSDASEVAGFSSRGNTGIEIEGEFGRFKPDVVAPGTFVVSARSPYWNEKEYYNPTNHTITTLTEETVAGTNQNYYSVYVPENAVGLNLSVLSGSGQLIRVWMGKDPSLPPDFVKQDNQVTAPPDGGPNFGPVNTTWWYSVGNTNATQTNTYALIRDLITTNDLGNYYEVLSNLNNSISGGAPHYYRYESGSSMAAATVSGTLALMQEFFEQRLQRTNSPALLKALLINGARAAGPLYFLETRNQINFQGWGLARLRNSLPGSLTNFAAGAAAYAMWLQDQSPTNALATGESRTHTVTVNNNAGRSQPLRVTLVWTDPPGSPAAGVKLVNDLDLIVTNRDSGEVYFGNHIDVGSNFNTPWDTNLPPAIDAVNNVENVYLLPPLGTNFTVTVRARRVNVNAVTAHTNGVVQDYALVISSGDGQVNGALTVGSNPVFLAQTNLLVTYVTNTFTGDEASGFLLDYQRVSANSPLIGTTNGMTNQWHFYVVTNTTSFSNAAFVTFIPTDLSIPRIGVYEPRLNNATRVQADIDLYVSTDPGMLDLSPAALAAANISRSRGGTEQVVLSNSVAGRIYYIGVKSEDQMAAEYSFFGVFSLNPFGDTNGTVQCFNVPQAIPDRSPDNVQGQINAARAICPCVLEGDTRRVIVTNTVTHEHFEDLIGNVAHGERFAVLNNHRLPPVTPVPPEGYSFIYEDNGEGNINPPVSYELRFTDGPGTLRDFVGEPRVGPWIFTFLDDAWTQTGQLDRVLLQIEESNLEDGEERTIAAGAWSFDAINVGIGATNLEVCVVGNTAPVELYIRKGSFPTRTAYDQFLAVNPPGDCLRVTLSDLPPLSPGRYFIGVFNSSSTEQTVRITATVDYDLNAIVPINWNTDGNEYLLDDAVTNSTLLVTNKSRIAAVEVGVRIDHPRVSDLALTLISPRGTRVLLAENRGQTNTLGMGSTIYVTNVVPVVANGQSEPHTNTIPTGKTQGSLTVDYDFQEVPDRMTIYYDNQLIYDTGLISGAGRFVVNYGPGLATEVVFVMNAGTNDNSGTLWSYTVSDVSIAHSYLTFTESTNRTLTPIKFLSPPYIPPLLAAPALLGTGFETAVPGDYVTPQIVDGWNASRTNPVTVLDDPTLAHAGLRSLALRAGGLLRTLPTTVGRNYQLKFAQRAAPVLDGLVSWWRAESNPTDFVDGNNGTPQGTLTYSPGMVGQSFNFNGFSTRIMVGDRPNLRFTNALTLEAWVFPLGFPKASNEVLSKWESTTPEQRSYTFKCDPQGHIILHFSADGGSSQVTAVTSTTQLPVNEWTHVAGTYDGSTLRIFVNGVEEGQTPWTAGIFSGDAPFIIGSTLLTGSHWTGLIDEPAVFNRALTANEIRDIYTAGAAGKCGMVKAPPVCVPSGAQVFIPGGPTNTFVGTTNWQTNTLFFTATATGTPLQVLPVAGQSGVLLDTFTLGETTSSLYALPEESLRALEGERADGLWQLEIWDSRTGATNQVSLLSWQLSFVFQNEFAIPAVLQPGSPRTTTIPPGQIAYYIVDAPFVARFATNMLFNATAGLNFYFNQTAPPGFDAANPGDVVFTRNDTDHTEILSTTNTTPPASSKTDFIAGRRYYLAIENSNTVNVTYSILVDFDLRALPPLVTLTNGVPYCTLNPDPFGLDYYHFQVSTNARRAQFALLNPSGDMTLLLRQGLPPTFAVFDYVSANPGTNHEVITVFDYSQPVALTPGDWYVAAANLSTGAVTYCIQANEWFVYGTNITITNIVNNGSTLCLTWASLPDVLYYVEGSVDSTNWVTISPTIIAVDFSTTYCIPLPTPYQFFRVREGVALDPVALPPYITRIEHVFNGILISWGGPANATYQVQWKSVLDGTTNWNMFTNLITSPTGFYQFLDDGTQTGGFDPTRFYRLQQLP